MFYTCTGMHTVQDVRSAAQPFPRTWLMDHTVHVKRVHMLYLAAYTEGGRYFGRALLQASTVFDIAVPIIHDYHGARSIGHIWLLWNRVRAFDWTDPDPDLLHCDLVNLATVQYNRFSRSTREDTESAGTVTVRLRTSCSSCSACSIRIQSSQIQPIECAHCLCRTLHYVWWLSPE